MKEEEFKPIAKECLKYLGFDVIEVEKKQGFLTPDFEVIGKRDKYTIAVGRESEAHPAISLSEGILSMNANLLFFPGVALGLFGFFKSLPSILVLINPRRIHCWFANAFERDQIVNNSQAVQGRLEELKNLGFSLLRVKNEKFPLWGPGARELSTVSIETNTFASIVLTKKDEPFIVYFYTPFRDTGFVYTRQQSTLPQRENSNVSVKNISSNNLNDLFHSHLERVKDFQQKGLFPAAVDGMDSRLEATYSFYASLYAKKILGTAILYASIPYLLIAGILAYLQASTLGYF